MPCSPVGHNQHPKAPAAIEARATDEPGPPSLPLRSPGTGNRASPWNAARLRPGQTELLGRQGQQLWPASAAPPEADMQQDDHPDGAEALVQEELGLREEGVASAGEQPASGSQAGGASADAAQVKAQPDNASAAVPTPASPVASTGTSPFKEDSQAEAQAGEKPVAAGAARRLDFDSAGSPPPGLAEADVSSPDQDCTTAAPAQLGPAELDHAPGAAPSQPEPGAPAAEGPGQALSGQGTDMTDVGMAGHLPSTLAEPMAMDACGADCLAGGLAAGQQVEHRQVLDCGTLCWVAAMVIGAAEGMDPYVTIAHQGVSHTAMTLWAITCKMVK